MASTSARATASTALSALGHPAPWPLTRACKGTGSLPGGHPETYKAMEALAQMPQRPWALLSGCFRGTGNSSATCAQDPRARSGAVATGKTSMI